MGPCREESRDIVRLGVAYIPVQASRPDAGAQAVPDGESVGQGPGTPFGKGRRKGLLPGGGQDGPKVVARMGVIAGRGDGCGRGKGTEYENARSSVDDRR